MAEKMTKAQREEAESIAKRCDVWDTAVLDVIEMFANEANDYEPHGFEQWIKAQRESRSYLFIQAAPLDREELAFGQANVSERGRLYKELGPVTYAERCKAWGLKGPNDFSEGTPPDGGSDRKPKKKPDSSNPFSKAGWNITAQGRVHNIDPAMAERLANSAGVKVGATKPVM